MEILGVRVDGGTLLTPRPDIPNGQGWPAGFACGGRFRLFNSPLYSAGAKPRDFRRFELFTWTSSSG